MSTGEPQDAGLERVNGGGRSVQTLPAAGGVEMPEFMDAYFRWLQRAFRGAVTVSGGACDEVVVMYLLGVPAVRLRRRSSDAARIVYEVQGGALARHGGIFEFTRVEEDLAMAVLSGFQPRLPWWVYRRTHGRLHASVMRSFGRSLEVAS